MRTFYAAFTTIGEKKSIMKRTFILSFALSALLACTSTYKLPEGTTETAEIIFEKGYISGNGLGSATSQEYFTVDDFECGNPKRLARFHWVSGDASNREVAASEITISAQKYIIQSTTGDFGVTTNSNSVCSGTLKFTPRENGRYSIKLEEMPGGDCQLKIADEINPDTPVEAEIRQGHICPYDPL